MHFKIKKTQLQFDPFINSATEIEIFHAHVCFSWFGAQMQQGGISAVQFPPLDAHGGFLIAKDSSATTDSV